MTYRPQGPVKAVRSTLNLGSARPERSETDDMNQGEERKNAEGCQHWMKQQEKGRKIDVQDPEGLERCWRIS